MCRLSALPSHFYGNFLAKQEQPTPGQFATTLEALSLVVLPFTIFPLLIALATAITLGGESNRPIAAGDLVKEAGGNSGPNLIHPRSTISWVT
jgi:hypothetical protein